MSKSLGNIIPFKDAQSRWGSGPLRLWLLSAHYRSNLDYNEQGLEQSLRLYERLRDIASRVTRRLERGEPTHYLDSRGLGVLRSLKAIHSSWHEALSDDFNLGLAMRWVWEFTNTYYRDVEASESHSVLLYTYRVLYELNRVYAVLDDIIEAPEALGIEGDLLELIVQVRSELRARRMYDLSDAIRDRLSRMGIKLIDYRDRTEWVKEGV